MLKHCISIPIWLFLAALAFGLPIESAHARPCYPLNTAVNDGKCGIADEFASSREADERLLYVIRLRINDGLTLYYQNRFEEALAEFNSIIETFPEQDTREASYGAAITEFSMGRYAQAAQDFNLSLGTDHLVYSWLCASNTILGRYNVAFDYCNLGIEEDTKVQSDGFYWRGYINIMQRRYAMAAFDLEQEAEHHPVYTQGVYYLGITYLLDAKYDLAIRTFNSLALREPNSYMPHFWLAVTAMKQADSVRAKQEMQVTTRILGGLDDNSQKRGTALINTLLGNPDAAKIRYQNAFDAGDTNRLSWCNHRLYLFALQQLFPDNESVKIMNEWFGYHIFLG